MSLMKDFNSGAIRKGFILDDVRESPVDIPQVSHQKNKNWWEDVPFQEPQYHSEVFSLHGFHFELKANHQANTGEYSFYLQVMIQYDRFSVPYHYPVVHTCKAWSIFQRLKPGDPVLSFRECERHTFSMRADRQVFYSIRVQYFDENNQCQMISTPMLSQRFGLGNRTSKSEVLIFLIFCNSSKWSMYLTSYLFPFRFSHSQISSLHYLWHILCSFHHPKRITLLTWKPWHYFDPFYLFTTCNWSRCVMLKI